MGEVSPCLHKSQGKEMKRYYKVYGVYGMNECTMLIRRGAARASVTFSGGSTAGLGITPAQFDTQDAIFQHIIEDSEQFKSGRIKLLRSELLEDDAEDEANDDTVDDTSEEDQAQDEVEGGSTSEETEDEVGTSDLEEVTVSCLADAKDYLVEKFGYKKTSLRGADMVLKAGVKNGVRFVGDLS